MTSPNRTGILANLRRAALRQDPGQVADRLLLECYLTDGDDAAFEGLVRRHGRMVLGVCRRVLGDAHEAEDAFQVTFLVFLRKAASIVPREMVGNWLHGVAYKTALKARTALARKRATEWRLAAMPAMAEPPNETWQLMLSLLDKELVALPEQYRLPIILCKLEGKTRKQASRQLGWAEGTVASRLARGLDLLAKRLRRHSLDLSSVGLAAAISQQTASAGVPAALLISTLKALEAFTLGRAAAGALPVPILILVQGVLRAMWFTKIARLTAMLLVIGGLAVGGATLLHITLASQREKVACNRPPLGRKPICPKTSLSQK